MKRIAILGSTGSIGQSALAVVDAHADRLQVVGLAAGENADRLGEQIARYRPRIAAMATGAAIDRLTQNGAGAGTLIAGTGRDGLVAVASHPDVDLVLCASAGTEGLEAVLAAIEHGKTIALANKEVLVMAGGIVTEAARRCGVPILPVDSEHNAIHQCLHGRAAGDVARLILTASGGPFRGRAAASLAHVSAADALKHPTWRMGRKITIDSATLMNKGLEVIEAYWLFGVPASRIDVLVHPQSVVHSMVELIDGSIIAQLGVTDMRLPIQYACAYPERWGAPVPSLNLTQAGPLEFAAPDTEAFPCLRLAYRALGADNRGTAPFSGLEKGPDPFWGSMPVVLNAANELAVTWFLEGRIGFTSIAQVIERTMDAHAPAEVSTLAAVRAVDASARASAQEIARGLELKVRT
ncbi:MAG TPA: 1-deoxy-D-xylulose-5-phosphate reductoisomerase [Vicinamibacterales bacterium]|jgi:1-deoxy-D-xylulose-5-phosphate reductoisomerase|nr:1-deoxy-D-xylulose-5-phosphate reductoisomerase [Vicinamibacterales bacterium]